MEEFKKGVVMKETTPDFRKGFTFAINCILDFSKSKKATDLQKVIILLEDTSRFINKGYFWEEK